MKRLFSKTWKPLLSALFAVGVFLVCLFPLRAVLHLHEQRHLFRWSAAWLRELWSVPGGWREWLVALVTQFFCVGWLGAAVVALLAVALQGVLWWVMRRLRMGHGWLYVLSFVPSVLVLWLVFVPQAYRTDGRFREAAEYDYLTHAGRWDAVLWKSFRQAPATDGALRCTNYALARKGRLLDQMFTFHQTGPDGLLSDNSHASLEELCIMSDVAMELGLVNDAERMAFDALVEMPAGCKSGRLLRRLAEANLVNGNEAVARKYLWQLRSTLFYGRWARQQLAGKADPRIGHWQQLRTRRDTLLTHDYDQLLAGLARENPQNKLAADYQMGYALLRLDHRRVAGLAQRLQSLHGGRAPRAVQECVAGYWMMAHPSDSLPIAVDRQTYETTYQFLKTVDSTGDMNHPSLAVVPYAQSYWSYLARTRAWLKSQPKP